MILTGGYDFIMQFAVAKQSEMCNRRQTSRLSLDGEIWESSSLTKETDISSDKRASESV